MMKLLNRGIAFLIFLTIVIITITAIYHLPYTRKRSVQDWLSHPEDTIDASELHDNWIIVTSISGPSKDIVKLAGIDGWHLLVIGDRKTPDNWSYPGVEYLSLEKQGTLQYGIASNIPYNSYTRKNIGYLYAIHRGARFIYDTDDDNHPTNGQIDFRLSQTTTGLVYSDRTADIINPYSHFGQPTIWPRGYPLESINNDKINNTYTLCTLKTPTIQQGLVNKDPDVDAIYRLTRKKGQSGFNITFDSRAPPLILPKGVFAPFNSQNTLFTYEALWALFLPTTVSFRVTDIWRGYWAQRLMWLLGHRLAFFPPNAIQVRNSHNYLEDFKDENQVYIKSGELIAFLKRWECQDSQEFTFFRCANRLSRDMVKAGFWGTEDANLIKLWFLDLKQIGYMEPTISRSNYDAIQECNEDTRTVYYSPVVQSEIPLTTFKDLMKFCGNSLQIDQESKSALSNDNILLIVVFNTMVNKVISILDNVYRDHFSQIIYCGEIANYQDIVTGQNGQSKRTISFIKTQPMNGYFGYECAIRAIEMNYAVDGYLIISDDVLFNFWNFKINLTKSAFQKGVYHQSRYKKTDESPWNWWNTDMGYKATDHALDELDRQSSPWMTKYLDNIKAKSLNQSIAINLADLYYLPKSERELFVQIAKVFYKHRVFVEIAVPTTLDGLNSKTDIQSMSGKSLWDEDRDRWKDFYNEGDMYLHPVKLTKVLADVKTKAEYCQYYIGNITRRWTSRNGDAVVGL